MFLDEEHYFLPYYLNVNDVRENISHVKYIVLEDCGKIVNFKLEEIY